MCPVAAPGDYNVQMTDDDCAAHLRRMAKGIPTPEDVFDMNPFIRHADYLPQGVLFLVNSQDPRHSEAGYWVETGRNSRLSSASPIVEKTTMQFYEGQAPNGKITVYLMHIYKLDRTQQYTKWLCRSEFDLELHLANLARMEENDPASSNDFEVVNGNERRPPAASESQDNPLSDLAEFYYNEPYNFIGEDYLELNDLMDYPSSSSRENSSALTMNSDYYLDSEASFREMRNNGYLEEQRNVNRMVSTTSGSTQVLMKPPLVSEYNKETHPKTTDPINKGGLTLPAATTDHATSQETKKWKSDAEDAKGNAIAGPSNSLSGGNRNGSSLTKMAIKFVFLPILDFFIYLF